MSQAAPADLDLARAARIAAEVLDPEVPVLNLEDLGVLRGVSRDTTNPKFIRVALTPTYVGCPAVAVIEFAVEAALRDAGFAHVKIDRVLAPAWSSDDITETGREKLTAYGIAPPNKGAARGKAALFADETVACPKCGSAHTKQLSAFGSTACKALWQCNKCLEPFDYFKCL